MASMLDACRANQGLPAKLTAGSRVGYDLSKVGAGASRGFSGKKKLEAAPWSGTWPAPGATLDLDFANNRGFVRGMGQGGVMDGITFTRASNGTFVGPDGLLAGSGGNQGALGKNLLAFPQDFDNAAWLTTSAGSSSLIQNKKQQNPFGIPDATAISESNQYGQFFLAVGSSFSFNSPLIYTRSVFVKYNGARYISLGVNSDAAAQFGNCNVLFDLVDKVVVSSEIGSNAVLYGSNVEDYGNGWLRLSITSASSTSTNSFHLAFHKTASISWGASSRYQIPGYTGDGSSGVYIYGAQLELGSTATEYFPTNINVPRFDWASTATVANKNLLSSTGTLTNWAAQRGSVAAAAISSPSGVSENVFSITSPSGNTGQLAYGYTFVIGQTYTFSAYAQQGTSNLFAISAAQSGIIPGWWVFDLSAGTITQTSNGSGTITNVGGGWYRCTVTATCTGTSNAFYLLSYNTTSNSVYVCAPQLEFGSSVTEYQPVAQPTTNTPLRPAATCNGLLIEEARTNRLLWCRDATQTQWGKTGITAAKDQTGIDGVANAASSLTATADGGTCIQTITLASGSRTGSVYLKRITGTGTVQVSLDGSIWSTVELSDTEWRRIVLSGTVTNPVVGVRLAVSGDAVAMDFGQVEDGLFATTPILTTTATATRASETASMSAVNFGNAHSKREMSFMASFLPVAGPSSGVNRGCFSIANTSFRLTLAPAWGSSVYFGIVGGASAVGFPVTYSAQNTFSGSYRDSQMLFADSSGVKRSSQVINLLPAITLSIGNSENNAHKLNGAIQRIALLPFVTNESQLAAMLGAT